MRIFVSNKTNAMKITTKRFYAGEYKVYRDGVFAGTITNGASESKEWTAFDESNEWIGTLPTKKDCLLMCY